MVGLVQFLINNLDVAINPLHLVNSEADSREFDQLSLVKTCQDLRLSCHPYIPG